MFATPVADPGWRVNKQNNRYLYSDQWFGMNIFPDFGFQSKQTRQGIKKLQKVDRKLI